MFKQLQPLDRVRHRELRFSPRQPYHFAAGQMLLPIVGGEAAMVAREYPIVFSRTPGSAPSALVGVREGVNAYVRPSGHWVARYVPSHVRRYPFMLAEQPAKPGEATDGRKFTLMIDAAAPHLGTEQGDALFTEAGEPTPLIARVQETLLELQRDLERTLLLVRQLEDAGLLVERAIKASPQGGTPYVLEGLRVLDGAKLGECSADTLQALVRSGALALAYAHVVSMTNLQDGQLVQGTAPAPAEAAGSVSFEGIDWSKLQ
jgi:hypothetical protein